MRLIMLSRHNSRHNSMQFPLSHDKLDGINFRRLFSSLSSTDWKTWDKSRVITWLSDIFNARDERDRSLSPPQPPCICVRCHHRASCPPRALIERVSRAFKSNDIDGRMLAHMTKVSNTTLNTKLWFQISHAFRLISSASWVCLMLRLIA